MALSLQHEFRAALQQRLAASSGRQDFAAPKRRHAVVAAVFRELPARRGELAEAPEAGHAELLLIERAKKPGDPWSGDMALPGGHREPCDADLLATAHRETREEVGLNLESSAEALGRLESVPVTIADGPRLDVIPLVFWWREAEAKLELDASEVREAFWTPTASLSAPEAQTSRLLEHKGQRYRLPATEVRGRLVWGLTYRIVRRLVGPPLERS